LYVYAEGEQQDESGTGEGAKRAIGNLPSQPSVIKVKSFYVNRKCKWNSNGLSEMKRNGKGIRKVKEQKVERNEQGMSKSM
jgi:hypothetical protein